MENPLILGHYGQEDLVDYALYRKSREMESVKKLLGDERIEEGDLSPCELEDYREPLAFSQETVVTVELSTGGDADGFKLTFNENKDLVSGLYYWADWGVYEEVHLIESELDLVDRLYSVSDWLSSF